MRLNKQQAEAVYAVLINQCGAKSDKFSLNQFVVFMLDESRGLPDEYRFQGELGFGGKLYLSRKPGHFIPEMLVACYVEDRTPERDAMIQDANSLLRALEGVWDC